MPSWNVKLGTRKQVVKVNKIINKKSDFVVVQFLNGKQQKLSDSNFPEWRQTKEGRKIELIIQESVVGARFLPEEFQERVQELFHELKRKLGALFYVWVCEYCKTMGYVEYEDGDDPQLIIKRIYAGHQKKIEQDCNEKANLRIFDHNWKELKEFTQIMSFKEVS